MVPVAAMALIVAVSRALTSFAAKTLDEPVNVCLPVHGLAAV